MAHRPRRRPIEKLEEELIVIRNSILQYENTLAALKRKEKHINESMEAEHVKRVIELLKKQYDNQ